MEYVDIRRRMMLFCYLSFRRDDTVEIFAAKLIYMTNYLAGFRSSVNKINSIILLESSH